MWKYEKMLEYPVNITKPDLYTAKILLTQYGGDDGEIRAALRYLNQRYSMPTSEAMALLTDIGTEELAHVEIIATMIHCLAKNATVQEIKGTDFKNCYAQNGYGLGLTNQNGFYLTSIGIGSHGKDYEANLVEDLAAEEKARATYEHLMDLIDNVEVLGPLAFLREREIVHFQRFGELLVTLQNGKY